MKVSDLYEDAKKPGTYMAAHFDKQTVESIEQYIKDNNIPNSTSISKLHLTILSSEKHLPDCVNGSHLIDPSIIAKPDHLDVFTSPGNDGEPDNNCLVLKVHSSELTKLHNDLIKEHNTTHKYGDFKPHITLSYNIGNMDITKLPDVSTSIPEIVINKTLCEPFKNNWARSESTT